MSLAQQQQSMLDAVFGRWDETALRGSAVQEDALRVRGLKAYRSNGHALAQRALGAAYPVVAQMLDEENFCALARAFWHACPPSKGDMALWGAELPTFIAGAPQLAEEPQLSDVARVEWALHEAATAADVHADPGSFSLLTEHDPDKLALVAAAGLKIVGSAWPVASIVNAHLCGEPPLTDAAQRMRDGVGETVVVWRQSFKPVMREALPGEAAFLGAVLSGRSLADCLGAAPDDGEFDFNGWLAPAFQAGLVVGASIHSIRGK